MMREYTVINPKKVAEEVNYFWFLILSSTHWLFSFYCALFCRHFFVHTQ